MVDIFESTSYFVFVLLFIYATKAATEKDLLACFDGPRKAYSVTENDFSESFDNSDLIEKDFISPLVEASTVPEKKNMDSNQVVKAEFDWREAEKLLMKFGSKRWNEINDDDIVPIDEDLFVMEGKKYVCSIITRGKNPKNHKFEPITHSLFTSKNIEIPVWDLNKYETKTVLCFTSPFCAWKPMKIDVISCPCHLTSEASSSTPVMSLSPQRSESKPERRKTGIPKQDVNVNLELRSGFSHSSLLSRNHLGISSNLTRSYETILKTSLRLAKSHERQMDNSLKHIRTQDPMLGNWLGLSGAPERVIERSLKLKKSHESALDSSPQLTEGPELALGSLGSNKLMSDSSGPTGKRKSVWDNSLKLNGSHQSDGTLSLGTPFIEEQCIPSTSTLLADEICIFAGGITNYVYFSRGVNGENSFFVYAKIEQANVLRVVAHLVLPEAKINDNLGLSLNVL